MSGRWYNVLKQCDTPTLLLLDDRASWNEPKLLEISAKTDGEPRFLLIGIIAVRHWSAAITYRETNIRIISVRRSRDEDV